MLAGPVLAQINDGGTTATGAYQLGPGDLIDVKVFGRPQLTSESIRVGVDGQIHLAMIDHAIAALCRTEDELALMIAKEYREYLVDPQVSVTVRQYSSQVVNLTGAVQRPGSFQLQRRVKLREVISLAGGATPAAGDTITIVRDEHRSSCEAGTPGTEGVKFVNLPSMLAGDEASDPYVLPGDFIHAAEAEQAFVVGNIYKPTPIPLVQPTTLTRALALAGGQLPSSRDNIHIIRHESGPQSKITVLKFSMKAVLANREEDPLIKPGDIVDVDISLSKALAKAALTTVASVGVLYFPITYIK